MEQGSKSLQRFATRYPFFFALAFFLVSFCLDSAIILVGHGLMPLVYLGILDVLAQAALALGVLLRLGWLRAAGFNGPSRWRSLYLLWLPALLALFYLASAFITPVSSVSGLLLAALATFLTGLDEEARFRGVVLQALLPLGPLSGAALSGLFFGLAHLNNLLTHSPLPVVLAQVVGAFLLGFGFAACRLRTRTIWPLILFHALYDLPANLTLFNARNVATVISGLSMLSVTSLVLVLILPGLILACYGLFLLRPGAPYLSTEKQLETPR